MIIYILILILIFIVRCVETYLFIKKISKICYNYDWKYINENEEYLISILEKDYGLTNRWSAYNFLYINGPSPLSMFLSPNILTINKIYNKEVIKKIEKYETI